jgi:hypothetical protein
MGIGRLRGQGSIHQWDEQKVAFSVLLELGCGLALVGKQRGVGGQLVAGVKSVQSLLLGRGPQSRTTRRVRTIKPTRP